MQEAKFISWDDGTGGAKFWSAGSCCRCVDRLLLEVGSTQDDTDPSTSPCERMRGGHGETGGREGEGAFEVPLGPLTIISDEGGELSDGDGEGKMGDVEHLGRLVDTGAGRDSRSVTSPPAEWPLWGNKTSVAVSL